MATEDYWGKVEVLAGAYVAWEKHLGEHFCKLAAGTGECSAGQGLLARLHAAYFELDDEERRRVLDAVRQYEYEEPY